MKVESDTSTLITPLFQPLRLWTPRVSTSVAAPKAKPCHRDGIPMRKFTMKGGFVTVADGERRLMIAGKLFRNRG